MESHPSSGFTNVQGKRTCNIYDQSSNIKRLVSWILDEYRYDKTIQLWSPDDKLVQRRVGCWFARYNKGDYTYSHAHKPHTWSWVYFINCPKGSYPLIFTTSGKKVKAEEGKVVIFDAQVLHEVPKNKCDNRVVCAGNITTWTEDFPTPINI